MGVTTSEMCDFTKSLSAWCKTSASVGLAEAPALWTDNPCLIPIFSDYFEIMWITALENISQQTCQLA